jgi:hypothetical protein
MATSIIDRIPECDPTEALYAVIAKSGFGDYNVTRFYSGWEYASNVYEAYRQSFKPEFQHYVRIVSLTNVIEPGERIDW